MNIDVANRVSGVDEYYFSKKLKEIRLLNDQGKNIINLGIGSPDLPPHTNVVEALCQSARQGNTHGYQSYHGIPELQNAFVQWAKTKFDVSISHNEILPLIGSKEGIMHINMTFLEEGDKVLVPNPGYPTYTSASKLTGAEVIHYNLKPENNYWPDFDELENLDTQNIKIMWINYPHMPTGARATRTLFERLVRFAQKHNILLCHDNPYALILNNHPISIMEIEGAKDCAIELHSLSKAYNMAGWRIGALWGKQDFLSKVMRFKSNMDSGMYKPVQLAAVEALKLGQNWHDSLNGLYQERKKIVLDIFKYLDCTPSPNQSGLFVWARIPNRFQDGVAFSDEYLYKNNVFITPGNIFGSQGDQFVRISLCSPTTTLKNAFVRIRANQEKQIVV